MEPSLFTKEGKTNEKKIIMIMHNGICHVKRKERTKDERATRKLVKDNFNNER